MINITTATNIHTEAHASYTQYDPHEVQSRQTHMYEALLHLVQFLVSVHADAQVLDDLQGRGVLQLHANLKHSDRAPEPAGTSRTPRDSPAKGQSRFQLL